MIHDMKTSLLSNTTLPSPDTRRFWPSSSVTVSREVELSSLHKQLGKFPDRPAAHKSRDQQCETFAKWCVIVDVWGGKCATKFELNSIRSQRRAHHLPQVKTAMFDLAQTASSLQMTLHCLLEVILHFRGVATRWCHRGNMKLTC